MYSSTSSYYNTNKYSVPHLINLYINRIHHVHQGLGQ